MRRAARFRVAGGDLVDIEFQNASVRTEVKCESARVRLRKSDMRWVKGSVCETSTFSG